MIAMVECREVVCGISDGRVANWDEHLIRPNEKPLTYMVSYEGAYRETPPDRG